MYTIIRKMVIWKWENNFQKLKNMFNDVNSVFYSSRQLHNEKFVENTLGRVTLGFSNFELYGV